MVARLVAAVGVTFTAVVMAMAMAVAAPVIEAPSAAGVGSAVTVTVTGSGNPRDFVTIVPKSHAEGGYGGYQYVAGPGPLQLTAPVEAGDYEVRLLGADTPYPTLARRPIRIDMVKVTLAAPASVAAGKPIAVEWTGPDNPRDFIAIGNEQRPYLNYAYTQAGSPATLTAPDQAGEYELRYFLAERETIIARRPITIGGQSATLSAPARVAGGAPFSVSWTGPDNPGDFITMVQTGTAERQWDRYAYTAKGSPAKLTAPDAAGDYELRYLTGQAYATLARAKISVTPLSASLQAPASAAAGSRVTVKWQGPGNDRDFITIVPAGAKEGDSGNYEYTARGNPVQILVPLAAGDYELRYSTGQSSATLARAPLRVTPAPQEPGAVAVTMAPGEGTVNAVEIILDASGSMLQRIGGERRIDIARRTLARITSQVIPAGTPFALRVFGREVGSCQTDLDIPLAPLAPAAVSERIAKLAAKNDAKTPIGASLEKVAEDLRGATGERLAILLTDGEETCGGDPAAAIDALAKQGVGVRVSIIGFAIDDEALAATFRRWADAGGGLFFDARDAKTLDAALVRALQPAIELVDGEGRVVAQGIAGAEPLRAAPGKYQVRLRSRPARAKAVELQPKLTAQVVL